jgi:hypothetical protein
MLLWPVWSLGILAEDFEPCASCSVTSWKQLHSSHPSKEVASLVQQAQLPLAIALRRKGKPMTPAGLGRR